MVFSSDTPEVTPERRDQILNAIADRVIRHGLVTPAIFFLQMGKPLAFLGSSAVFLAQPFAGLFINEDSIEDFGHLLSERENVERLLLILEEKDQEFQKKQKQLRAEQKEAREKQREARRLEKEARKNSK
jgi:hypothetical protein